MKNRNLQKSVSGGCADIFSPRSGTLKTKVAEISKRPTFEARSFDLRQPSQPRKLISFFCFPAHDLVV